MGMNSSRIIALAKAKTGGIPTCVVESHRILEKNKTVAHVELSFNKVPSSQQEIIASINKAFNKKVHAIPNSFRQIADKGSRFAIAGFIKLNNASKVLTPELEKGFRVMASNVLMDNVDDSVWAVTEANGVKMITRTLNEDLSELVEMASVSKRHSGVPMPTIAGMQEPCVSKSLEVVAFLNVEKASIDYGVKVAPNKVYSLMTQEVMDDVEDVGVVDLTEVYDRQEDESEYTGENNPADELDDNQAYDEGSDFSTEDNERTAEDTIDRVESMLAKDPSVFNKVQNQLIANAII